MTTKVGFASIDTSIASRRAVEWYSVAAVALGVPLAALVVLIATKPGIFLPDPWLGWVDAWYYVGFAQNLPESLRAYSQLYQSDRIPVTLPAYIAHQFTTPLVANYLVKGVYFVASVAALFLCLRRACGTRTALFVAAVASLHSFFVHAFGAGYVDGPASAYLLLAICLADAGVRQQRLSNQLTLAFFSGLCLAAVVMTQFIYVVILPFLFAYVILLSTNIPERRWKPGVFLAYAAGILAAAIALWRLYHYWQVPSYPMVATFRHVTRASESNYLFFPNSRRWLLEAIWLVVPGAVAGWTLMRILASVRSVERLKRVPAESWLFLCLSATWVALYFLKQPWITFPFYTSFLLSVAFLALGPVVREHVEALSSAAFQMLVIGSCVALALGYQFRFDVAWPLILVAAGCVTVGTYAHLRVAAAGRRSLIFLAALVAAGAVVNAGSADYSTQVRHSYRNRAIGDLYGTASSALAFTSSPDETYTDVIEAARRISPRLKPYEFLFWYDAQEPLSMFYRSVTSMFYAWSANELLPENFTRLDANAYDVFQGNLGAGRQLVIMTENPDLVAYDGRFEQRWKEEFHTAGTRFFVYSFWARSQ